MPKGNLVCVCTKCTFFAHLHAMLGQPLAFPRALGCGARTGAACTLGASVGPAPGSVARALGVSRNLASNHGIAFPRAKSMQDDGNPHRKTNIRTAHFRIFSAVYNSSHLACGRLATWSSRTSLPSRATAVTLRARFFVPRCYGAYVYRGVCVRG